MPATRWQRRRVFIRANLPWRRMLGRRTVRRHVQGVDLSLPWAHLLPDFTRVRPWYGQNLVQLAVALHRLGGDAGGPLTVLDIGANIGDSAAQILAATDARVLCVEGDPYWARYLRENLGGHPRVVIEESLLVPADDAWSSLGPVRSAGTTRFARTDGDTPMLPTVSARELRARYPEFSRLRLLKSDTDGFDPIIVPAVAEAWSDEAPVLFFEFDPILAAGVDDRDPNDLWGTLADLGYTRLAVWDNTGDPLGQLHIDDAAAAAAGLAPRPVELGYDFWDVAACHADDMAAAAAFDELVPESFSALGAWRARR